MRKNQRSYNIQKIRSCLVGRFDFSVLRIGEASLVVNFETETLGLKFSMPKKVRKVVLFLSRVGF